MKQLTEQDVRQISQEEMQKNYRAGTTFVNPHQHNGIDNLKINEADLIPSNKGSIQVIINAVGRFVIKTVSNPSSVSFSGYASDGGDNFATTTGTAYLGPSYYFTLFNPTTVIPGPKQSFIQSSAWTSYDKTGPLVVNVGVTNESIIYGDDGSAVYFDVKVSSFTNNSITIDVVTLASGWQVVGNLIVT